MTVDLDLVLDEHRRPDGTRPLVVGKPRPGLTAAVLDAGERRCTAARIAGQWRSEPPAECRRVITAGEHYLLHLIRDLDERTTKLLYPWCAPCAIREYAFSDVREAP